MHPLIRCLPGLCALIFSACAAMPPQAPPASGDTWVILSPGAASVRGTWTPSAEQVLAGRAAARHRLENVADTMRPVGDAKWRLEEVRYVLSHWAGYRLQAYGITQNHKQLIRLSFLTPHTPDDGRWRQNALYLVCDGWAAYWHADYDPVTGVILWWQTNGVA